jgi:hypothetical protein
MVRATLHRKRGDGSDSNTVHTLYTRHLVTGGASCTLGGERFGSFAAELWETQGMVARADSWRGTLCWPDVRESKTSGIR